MSAAAKQRMADPVTRARVVASMRATPYTPERGAAHSLMMRGLWQKAEYRANLRAKGFTPGFRGKHTEATKAKVSAAQATIWTPERRAAVSLRERGNTWARDACIKVSHDWPDGLCVYCLGPARTWDHVIPERRGGLDTPDNKVPACLSCNSSKGELTPAEWFAWHTGTPIEDWL